MTKQAQAPRIDPARAGHLLALRLRAAYLSLHRRSNMVFARFNLTADQFVLLTALTESNNITQKELTRITNSDPNTISDMVARLERRGLLERQRHADDGRALTVSLTDAGSDIQREAMEAALPLRKAVADLIPSGDIETLLAHLDRIVDGLCATGIHAKG